MADISFIMAMSCAPPALIGLYKYKRVDKKFHPFLLAMVLSLMTELIIKVIIKSEAWTWYYIAGDIYYLVNVLLYQAFFIRVLELKNRKTNLFFTTGFLVCVVANLLIKNPLSSLILYAAFLFSVFIFVQATRLLRNQVFQTGITLLRNPLFYIAAGCIIYNIFFMFIQGVFFVFGTDLEWLTNNSFYIEKGFNVFTYLLFTIGILWMPKTRFYSKSS